MANIRIKDLPAVATPASTDQIPMENAAGTTQKVTNSQLTIYFKGLLAPLVALGDLLYGGAAGAPTILTGNIAATIKFLAQTGTGAVSAAPGWVTLLASHITTALGFTPANKAGDTFTGAVILAADPTAALGAATKQYVDTLKFYDMVGGCGATVPAANQELLRFPVPQAMTLKAGLTTSVGSCGTNPTSSFVCTIKKNGTALTGGTITISTSGAFTFALTSDAVLAAGDVITIVAPGTADATAALISILLRAVLS